MPTGVPALETGHAHHRSIGTPSSAPDPTRPRSETLNGTPQLATLQTTTFSTTLVGLQVAAPAHRRH
ncbi:hypothetical protein PF010_g28269, partial [Phytophthora fragariae]